MKLVIEISTENAAFCDPFTGNPDSIYMEMELSRIIERQILPNLENGNININLRDTNGNYVGRMEIK